MNPPKKQCFFLIYEEKKIMKKNSLGTYQLTIGLTVQFLLTAKDDI